MSVTTRDRDRKVTVQVASRSTAGRDRLTRKTDADRPKPTRWRALRLGGREYLDGRSWAAKRIKTLELDYRARLRNPSDAAILSQIHACAELQVICELRRSQALHADQPDSHLIS